MKKIICKKEYDTEKAELVKKVAVGAFGDESGYEESLYKLADGAFFLYVNGGKTSQYPKADMKRMAKDAAAEWMKNN